MLDILLFMSRILENFDKINELISSKKFNINKGNIIAVTKNFGPEIIKEAIKAGIYTFGENRVQECEAKFLKILKDFPQIKLHMIGPLQTNKIKKALTLFNVIHTLDREKVVNEIKKHLIAHSTTKDFFVQVNIGNEAQKSGIHQNETAEFVKWCKMDMAINIIGLMCIPPDSNESKKYFLKLQELAKKNNLPCLSMGMSNDYLDALEFGATHIRLGTIIFGKR